MTNPAQQVIAVCVICRKDILGNKHMTRSRYCGRCFDAVENERLKLMGLIRKAAIRRVQRRLSNTA